MHTQTHVYCRIGYFICAKSHASSLEHTKVYEVENGDNHSRKIKKKKKKKTFGDKTVTM